MTFANEKIEHLLISLVAFKKFYESNLTAPELSLLKKWIKTLQCLEYVPISNNHFITCVYFENIDRSPSGCICQSIHYILAKFLEIKRKYSVEEDLEVLSKELRVTKTK